MGTAKPVPGPPSHCEPGILLYLLSEIKKRRRLATWNIFCSSLKPMVVFGVPHDFSRPLCSFTAGEIYMG